MYDSKSESIGFLNESVSVPDTTSNNFKLFIEPDTLPHVLKAQFVAPGRALIAFTTTMIQACELAKTDVPHYCWHPKLPVVGNCRMCLVEFGTPDRKSVV